MTAWPTVALAVLTILTVVGSVLGVSSGVLHPAAALLVSTIACFAGFTPVHEAAHGNISERVWLNELVGHCTATLMTGVLLPYRYIHGQHHRSTNVPGEDPDLWAAHAAPWVTPLLIATQDVGYLRFYLQRWWSRPLVERANLVAGGLFFIAVLALSALAGEHALFAVVLGWFLPARIALVLLAWTFAWLPHAPHTETDPHRATTVHSGWLCNILLLGQSYHLVHHLRPAVPFFRLAAVWRRERDVLLAAGVVDRYGAGSTQARSMWSRAGNAAST